MSENIWEKDNVAFLYEWTDHKTDMLYVGSHKGTPDDGYICSSKYMKKEYKKRPDDFTRKILLIGEDLYIREMEANYLRNIGASSNPKYYNKSNSYPKIQIFGVSHKPETKKKQSESRKKLFELGEIDLNGENNPNYKYKAEEILTYSFKEANKLFGISSVHYYRLKCEERGYVIRSAGTRGENHYNTKLSEEDAKRLIEEYNQVKILRPDGGYRAPNGWAKEKAKKYGVTRNNISGVTLGKSWKYLHEQ